MAVLKVYNGSTWDVAIGKVYDGAAWVEKMNFYDGSVQVPLYPVSGSPLVSMPPSFIVYQESDDGEARTVGIRVKRDGTVEIDEGSWSYDDDYLASGLPNATIGDSYEVYWTGDTPDSGPFETWTTISSTIAFEFTGVDTWNGTMSIREIADTGNTDSATVQLEVEDTS